MKDNIIGAKELLKQALREHLAKQIATIVLQIYPEACFVQYNANVEYNDQDDEYYGSMLSIMDQGHNYVYNTWDYEGDDEEADYQKFVGCVNALVNIDYRDYAFAFGFDATVDIRPYREVG